MTISRFQIRVAFFTTLAIGLSICFLIDAIHLRHHEPIPNPAPAPKPPPSPSPHPLPPPKPEPTPEESIMEELIKAHNEARVYHNLKPLAKSDKLMKSAMHESTCMVKHNSMSHFCDGSPFKRMRDEGYNYSYAGENIAWGQEDVKSVMKAWMSEPFHRWNVLGGNFTEIGVGIAYDRNKRIYWSVDFGQPANRENMGVMMEGEDLIKTNIGASGDTMSVSSEITDKELLKKCRCPIRSSPKCKGVPCDCMYGGSCCCEDK